MAANPQYGLTMLFNDIQHTDSRSKRKRENTQVQIHDGSEGNYLTTHGDQSMNHNQFNLGNMDHGSNGNLHANGEVHSGNVSDTAAAALSQYTMNLPSSTEHQFMSNDSNQDASHQIDSFITGNHGSPTLSSSEFNMDAQTGGAGANSSHLSPSSSSKPAVGTAEWHQIRKDNHKEVERRRRETINEGINELAKVVPNCEKNKGAILARAVQYIAQLKENEAGNIEKWTLEKLVAEQVIKDLAKRNERLQVDVLRAKAERDEWRALAAAAGVDAPARDAEVARKAAAAAPDVPDDVDDGAPDDTAAGAGTGTGSGDLSFEA